MQMFSIESIKNKTKSLKQQYLQAENKDIILDEIFDFRLILRSYIVNPDFDENYQRECKSHSEELLILIKNHKYQFYKKWLQQDSSNYTFIQKIASGFNRKLIVLERPYMSAEFFQYGDPFTDDEMDYVLKFADDVSNIIHEDVFDVDLNITIAALNNLMSN